MLAYVTTRRPLIDTDLDKPNRLLSNSSFFIHPSAFRPCLWFLAKNRKADAKLDEPSNAGLHTGAASRVFDFHLN
jgi:hypothetical protein